ncbi:MAG TPA: hypothetical protein VMM36_02365 [Opitutaceae bacterium]|nr:hypothetical protein [Opitutaceae bacterium]
MGKILVLGLLLICCFFAGCGPSDPYQGLRAETPSVFYLGRSTEDPDLDKIVRAAAVAFNNDDAAWSYYDNVVIVEESDYWTVSFHVRGNGAIEPSFLWPDPPRVVDGNFVVHLSKDELTILKTAPDGSIKFVPQVPGGFRRDSKREAAKDS